MSAAARAPLRPLPSGTDLTFGALLQTEIQRKLSDPMGTICLNSTTLMSAVSSIRRVNSWLSFKRLFEAVPGTAGGAVVVATVDHTLMRGSKPHDR